MTRAVFAAGVPAPQVFDEVTHQGRFGMVLSRLDGPTLRKLWLSGAVTSEKAGAILAGLYMSVHKTALPSNLITLRHLITAVSQDIPKHILTGTLALIERLPPAYELCHVDLHLDNVIITTEGPKIIDWAFPVRATWALDLARFHVIYFDLVYIQDGIDSRRPHALNAAVQSEYARLAGLSDKSLTAAMESYLPIMRAYALGDPGTHPTRRERLIQQIEAALKQL